MTHTGTYTSSVVAIAIAILVALILIAGSASARAPQSTTRAIQSTLGGFAAAALLLVTLASSFILAYGEVGALNTPSTNTPQTTSRTVVAPQSLVAQVVLLTPTPIAILPTLTPSSMFRAATSTNTQFATRTHRPKTLFTSTPTGTVAPETTIPTATTMVTLPATSVPAPIATIVSRHNGAPVYAQHRIHPPSIDGDLGDWDFLRFSMSKLSYGAGNWQGPSDQNGSFAISWDVRYLYISARVEDDAHVQRQSGMNIFKGDSVDLVLDVDLEGDYYTTSLNADDYQVGLSPGDLVDGHAAAQAYLWYPRSGSGTVPGILLEARSYGAAGFQLEAAIPWSVFGINPVRGMVFGFVMSSSDNDHPYAAVQQTMLSTVASRKLVDPTTWGTLVLKD